MPQFILPPRPGRPKRHPVDVLFTRLWVSAVKVHSGLSPHAIEQELEARPMGQGSDGVKRSRKWHLYESGERVPQRQPDQPCSVDLAEARYPGTAAYFDAPMKALLRRDEVDAQWVDEAMASLAPEVASLLFEPVRSSTGHLRSRAFDRACANRLVEVAGFDGLQATTLLMTKAQLIASPELRDLAWQAYVCMQPAVAELPIVAPLADELFMLIDTTLKRWVYLRPDRRQEMVFFTNELRANHGHVEIGRVREVEALLKRMIERSDSDVEPPAHPGPALALSQPMRLIDRIKTRSKFR